MRHPTRSFDAEGQTPGPVVDTEAVRAIAREEGEAAARVASSEHTNECGQRGHACALWDAVKEMKREIQTMATQQASEKGQLEGAMRAQTRTITIIVALVGLAGLAAQVIGMVTRMR